VLDVATTATLATYLERISLDVELVASLDDSAVARETRELLAQTAALSPRIVLREDGTDERQPSFAIRRVGTDVEVRFAGLPMGHEFTSFVLALLQVGGNPVKADAGLLDQVRGMPGGHRFEVFFSQSCQNCPDVVQALNALGVTNASIDVVSIDGAAFPAEAEARGVLAVPTVFMDGELFGSGRMTLEEIVGRLDSGAGDRAAAAMSGKDEFDVLVVGGGPAGAAAAIYAARKGIRTGLVAERFGGQVLDTMAIENFISVAHTEGPRLAAALEQHVDEYDVDLMTLQQATGLVPAAELGGLHQVRFASGATLSARSLVLATGARWRTMGVPGEDYYRNKGVTFCPHCDGPLFKGKRVAVIGGGNSGVEAAIDLAGVVAHVTLIEFDDRLRADEVLQRKLRSLPNVDVIVSALSTEVVGDGAKVTALRYDDRVSGASHEIVLEGVFVQIGLLPSTEWLRGAVELSARGEVVIDDRGATSVPGVFAAGDCTTVPFKQIVIAVGAGATASLSAFDHLIRTSAPAAELVNA
jgi:alkyl hydroperoxide reductase subunit F